MNKNEITVGDEVLCKPDGNLRGCEVLKVRDNEVRVKFYPGPSKKWMEREEVTLKENYKADENTIIT